MLELSSTPFIRQSKSYAALADLGQSVESCGSGSEFIGFEPEVLKVGDEEVG